MLVPTLHYFSTQPRVILWDLLLYSFIKKGHCQAFQKVLLVPDLSVILHTLDSQIFLEVQKHFWSLGARLGLYGACLKISHLNCLRIHFFPHHAHLSCLLWTTDTFPHIPFIHCTFFIHMNNLPLNFHQINIFSTQKLYRQLHFRGTGMFIFMPKL